MVVPALVLDEALWVQRRPRRAWAWFALSAPLACLVGEFALGGALGVRVPTLVLLGLTAWSAVELGRLRRGAAIAAQEREAVA